jgi:N6-adenosine-specific RNA methylase IME4
VSEPDPSDVKPCAPGSTSCPHRELCWVESPWAGLSPPYSTIVADPPWHYDARVIEWGRAEPMPYSTMTLDEIAALPVTDLSRPGAHLYLWTTNRYLDDAFDVARAWGFDPVTTLVWCKEPHGQGPGGRFAITTEFILFARDRRRSGDVIRAAREAAGLSRGDVHRLVRGGKPTGIVFRWEADDCLPTTDDWSALQGILPMLDGLPYPYVVASEEAKVDSTWFQWARGRHSVKPDAFGDLVERVSPGPYVELFCRRPRLGWDSWGKGYEIGVTA